MDELIKREDAIEAAKDLLKYHGKKTMTDQFIDYASTNAMEKIPNSLIRCKDCRYRIGDYCHNMFSPMEYDKQCSYVFLDGFCSMAERGEDG